MTPSGQGSSRCCRTGLRGGVGGGGITGSRSTRSRSSTAPAHPGWTCPSTSGRGRGPQSAAEVGRRRHLGARVHRSAGRGRRRRRSRLGRRGRLHHRPGSSARRRGPSKGAPAGEPDHHALGRSRGGLTTKIHLTADSRCRPLAFVLTPGQAGDAPAFDQVMARLRVPRPVGRPRTTPEMVLADKAYSSRAIRGHLRRRGIRAVIPQPADQAANRKRLGRLGGRPPAFDREAYKQRNTVERCINRLKQWRGLATRYDKTATIYLAGLHIAAIFIWSAR
ncbi:transposase [Streptomyces viridochromogenes DSM 40736]|uniref:Transposase n=1 Tax=Streptomyces viridochromogenes (strain DSM 40736 / JCM 4977 / BCRC 1201 / Tue 494) TaxID=591159 RepID=D9X323_STRVT|nr:transposase [Streptomyces viridochromogenes DSM 40736]